MKKGGKQSYGTITDKMMLNSKKYANSIRSGSVDTYNDSSEDILLSRKIARFLSRFSWYFPKRETTIEGEIPPDLDEAWAFFEHVTLGRYTKDAAGEKTKAIPGLDSEKTFLYSVFSSENDISQFGIGLGMYFSNLRKLSLIFVVAFLINFYLYWYYRSDEYTSSTGIHSDLRGSAMCGTESQHWMPCPECKEEDWLVYFTETKSRFALSPAGLPFIKVNDCDIGFKEGLASYLTCLFVFIALNIMRYYEKKQVIKFDESQQTATDYSIAVTNPPKDARDPEEWKAYFSQVCEDAQAVLCTVVIDNENLVKKLAERITLINNLDLLLPPGVQMDETKLEELVQTVPPVPWYMKPFSTSAASIYKKILKLDTSIEKMTKKEFQVSDVFVTFETEQSQRKILERLSVGDMQVWSQRKKGIPSERLFRGKHVLKVIEPAEPSSVRWLDLDESYLLQIFQRIFTLIISLALIVAGAYLIAWGQTIEGEFFGFTVGAFMITVFNTITPRICKMLMKMESHRNEGSYEESLFLKICTFRWTNTAIVLYIITAFSEVITKDVMMSTVDAVFTTEIYVTPILMLLDYTGHFKRHILAPRAPDQKRMDLQFTGVTYSLAERYTDMNKILFVTFFYAAVFPAGFLFGSISLIVHYVNDKFLLFKTWAQGPPVGTQLPGLSTKFISIALVTYFIMTSYTWYFFNFDNACEWNGDSENILLEYAGGYNVTDLSGKSEAVVVTNTSKVYNFCSQDLLREDFRFPSFSRYQGEEEDFQWMSEGQERIVNMFAWTTVVVVVYYLFTVLIFIVNSLKNIFRSTYEPVGEASTLSLKEVSIQGYIPQIVVPGFRNPKFLCDVRGLDEYISWDAPGSYEIHNLMYQIPSVKESKDDGLDVKQSIFSMVKYWPTE